MLLRKVNDKCRAILKIKINIDFDQRSKNDMILPKDGICLTHRQEYRWRFNMSIVLISQTQRCTNSFTYSSYKMRIRHSTEKRI
ncbi:hypothetical protein QLX08_005077 [Tetragonisca angustula]|uniref:Uncharacterized protein n=1 Tax=Tetragonisca angustula TaxID=166442 RepID=A0AAW0ZZR5_9HYME